MLQHKNPPYCIKSEKVSSVVTAVTGFANKITPLLQSGVNSNEMFADLKIVAEMLQENYSPAEVEEVLSCPEIINMKSAMPKLVAKMETELEKSEAQRQIEILDAEGIDGFEKFILYDKYKNLARKEWLLYQQLYTDSELRQMKFAFAGCGGMPTTAIGMARTFGVNVDCYDVDPEAALLAKQVVAKLGLGDKMGVYHGNALDIDYSRYDIVIVANLAQPQMEILARIAGYKNIKAVVVRRVNGLVSLMYSSFPPESLQETGLRLVSVADPNDKKSVHQSVLLVRQGGCGA